MDGTTIGLIAVGVVFGVDLCLLLGLVSLKAVHRRRMQRHDSRRAAYVAVLSRHLAFENHTDPIGAKAGDDDAFIDAIIDLRNVVSGTDIDTLAGIVDRTGLARRQVAKLKSRFPLGRRLRAAVSLAEIGDESTAPILIEHLDDREPEVRIQCARGLGRMQYTAAMDPILDRLGYEHPWVRARFADTLVGFGAKATWPLLAYVRVNLGHDENVGVIEAIRILRTIGDREAGPPLAGVLRSTYDPEVQIAAVEALGKVGGPLALGPLRECYLSPDWRLRAKAATALGEVGDPSVNATLAAGLGDENWWVRRNSAAALASLPGGGEVLVAALESGDRFAGDAAAEALADSGALAEARDRVESGRATVSDHILLGYVAAQEEVPA
jgi:HEAT repeat protein